MVGNDDAQKIGLEFGVTIEIRTRREPTPEQSKDLDEIAVLLTNAAQKAVDDTLRSIGLSPVYSNQTITGYGDSQFKNVKTGNA